MNRRAARSADTTTFEDGGHVLPRDQDPGDGLDRGGLAAGQPEVGGLSDLGTKACSYETPRDPSRDLTKAQRRRIREALARKGSIRAVIFVRVIGDVGPADATEIRYADIRVVR